MYETILGSLDGMAASLGLLRESARARSGVNPWGYNGGMKTQIPERTKVVKSEEKGRASEESAATFVDGDVEKGQSQRVP